MGVIDAQRASSIDIPIAGTAQKTMGDPSIIIACVALAASGLAAGAVAFRKLRGSRVNPTNELPVTDPPAPRPVSSVVAPSPREQVEMPTPKPFLGMPTASIETLPIQIYCPTQATVFTLSAWIAGLKNRHFARCADGVVYRHGQIKVCWRKKIYKAAALRWSYRGFIGRGFSSEKLMPASPAQSSLCGR